ncbi:mitochondrial large subunit ribosomal protein-domain-containing protein [Pyronema domesticum]|uniref:Large ribosomal subunit protein mL49 n=1 Tax=Pyronema omphalodes (strain CBS 100304) TaxID=1076935 RepID=U4L1P1_PYROM|nr:mitochondrial large subunit ribosomal protein-domain-containing protein [Pyronema domesticum]CCX09812.1 Similar to Uncharacterized protein C3H8.03; acc. no. Q10139 [Pyronema omphalodes CBS 100304]
MFSFVTRVTRPSAVVPRICRFSTSTILKEAETVTVAPVAEKPLPYFVHRSKTNNLPVYEGRKRGGNFLITKIRKVEGDVAALRQNIIDALEMDPARIHINQLTRHIIIKGHWGKKVEKFLAEQRF